MAARRTMRARDRLGSAQPLEDESDTDGVDGEASVKNSVSSKLYATLLVLPGTILYVYILYIILANLLYPCSLSPFFPRNRSSSSATSDTDKSAGSLCSLRSAILNNAALLVLFAAQHSLMARSGLKQLWNTLGLSAISRLIYVFTTCCTIQCPSLFSLFHCNKGKFIHHFWVATPSHTLWECHGYLLTLSLKAVHSFCWLSIACSLFTIDYLELLGIKQLYYSYNGFGDPLHYKSAEQQYLLRHMRHPIFTAPFILMWAVPVMSYDRLLLAVMLPLYLAWASGISALDMKYVRTQFINKWRQLLKDHHR